MVTPLIAMPGGWELIVIVLVVVLLFGARKLPELARGTGQALRIFKAETKGLSDESDASEEKRDELPSAEDTSQTAEPQSNPSENNGR